MFLHIPNHGSNDTMATEGIENIIEPLTNLDVGVQSPVVLRRLYIDHRQRKVQWPFSSLIQRPSYNRVRRVNSSASDSVPFTPKSHQRAADSADLDKPVPIAVVARQSRRLQHDHNPDLAQDRVCRQALESGAVCGVHPERP